jgi:hypothetical protein
MEPIYTERKQVLDAKGSYLTVEDLRDKKRSRVHVSRVKTSAPCVTVRASAEKDKDEEIDNRALTDVQHMNLLVSTIF